MPSPIFSGPATLRHPREGLALLGVLLWAFPLAGVIGFFIHESVTYQEVALFIVIAMLYVTLARGRLIGSSVMIHESQYPRVFAIVKHTCAALQIPMPLIFVREDYHVPAAALGFGEPYALVLSSHFIEHFEDDELAFVIGRQLGHIAAGHTRFLSLLSVNGNENPLVAVIFGPWLRVCELTCDKVGLLVCGSVNAAARAIAVSMFHHFGRHVNIEQFAEQGREIANDSILRWGEWLGGEPYATRRIEEMKRFRDSVHFERVEEWFVAESNDEPVALPNPGEVTVARSDCAGWWRRATAVFIDLIVVSCLISAIMGTTENVVHVNYDKGTAKQQAAGITINTDNTKPKDLQVGWVDLAMFGIKPGSTPDTILRFFVDQKSFWAVPLYMAILVGLAGQTFGMMITGLRVVTTDFRPPGLGRALWRYAIVFVLWFPILWISLVQHRVMLHDRLSGTRLITAERAMARATARAAAAPATVPA